MEIDVKQESYADPTHIALLYENHEIKDELVISAETFQRTNFQDFEQKQDTKPHEKNTGEDVSDSQTKVKKVDTGSLTASITSATNSREVYMCDSCDLLTFPNKSALGRHIGRSHGSVKCYFCPMRFSNVVNQKIHARNVHLEKNFGCEICPKKFSTPKYLRMHMNFHDNEKMGLLSKKSKSVTVYRCKICSKEFYNNYYFHRHVNGHETTNKRNEKQPPLLNCETCGEHFKSSRLLVFHMRMHSQQIFECDICKKKFLNKRSIQHHIRCHALEKTYACKMCPKKYTHNHLLSRHNMRAHGLKKNIEKKNKRDKINVPATSGFKCNICEKTLTSRTGFKCHLLYHAGKRKFVCNHCGKRFIIQHDLTEHKRSHTKPYSCSVCAKKFANLYVCRKHEKSQHS